MFECRPCLLRGLRAIAGDAIHAQSVIRRRKPLLSAHLPPPPIRRAASTSVATKTVEDDELLPSAQAQQGDAFDAAEGKREKGLARSDARALRMELQYLSDPLKLAEHVRYTLRCNKPEKALNLCRLASKQGEVIVSWNHCVDWHMSHGKIDEAIRIYNEMKKRAQFPDSYTYILLLRGLAKLHHHGDVVKQANVVKAMSIYNSMTSPTSRVRPSVYHTNATLKVCSAALDMDSLWTIAAKLPSKGKGAPDHITYAIILNAIRHGAMGDDPDGAQLDQIASRRQEAVNQGRRIWQEVIPKWRAGEVHIDEELVCTMGRLLLISKRMQDWDDVLSLIEQTMNVERQIAPVGSVDRRTEHVPQEIQSPGSAEESPEDADGYRDAPSTKAFRPVKTLPPDSSQPRRPTTLAYVTPGNPTLSMLIGACTELRTTKTANAYWDLFTAEDGPYRLHADRQNFHALFRLLGKNRSSAKAVEVLKSMPESEVDSRSATFRIVMSTCVRDKNNHNALEYARVVVDEMEKHCPNPDVRTLIQYLNLALKTEDGPKIVSALDRLEPIVHKLRSRIAHGGAGQPKARSADVRDEQESLGFFQAIVGVIDTLTNRGLVPQEDFGHWRERRGTLTQIIGRTKGRLERETQDPQIRRSVPVSGREMNNKGRSNGLQMRETEFALKELQLREKRMQKREEGRKRSAGLRNWDVGRTGRAVKEGRQRAVGLRNWDGGQSGRGGAGAGAEASMKGGFADSPMDFAV